MTNKVIISAISTVIAMGVAGTSTITMADTNTGNKSTPMTQEQMKMMTEVKGMERCYGITKKGQNDCGGDNNSCAGESKKDGDKNAWINVPTGLCSKIVGGSLKPSQEV